MIHAPAFAPQINGKCVFKEPCKLTGGPRAEHKNNGEFEGDWVGDTVRYFSESQPKRTR